MKSIIVIGSLLCLVSFSQALEVDAFYDMRIQEPYCRAVPRKSDTGKMPNAEFWIEEKDRHCNHWHCDLPPTQGRLPILSMSDDDYLTSAKPDIVSDLESHKGEIAMLVKLGRWDKVEDLLSETLISKIEKQNIEEREDYLNKGVRSLKPPGPGAHVYGESNFQFRKTTNNGGDIQQSSGGHKVINSDGRVSEYRYGK